MNNGKTGVRRLVIVSNRLPFNAAVEDGVLKYKESTGGLVTGLAAFLDSVGARTSVIQDYLWVGWPGGTVEESCRASLKAEALAKFKSHPVFLTQEQMDDFYHGFCNKTIWPLFHYFPTYASFNEVYWQQYLRVNEIFCDAVGETLKEDDIVWVHDYHLMMLPALIKARMPAVPVGFFLHIPFPSFEIFRLLPGRWRRQLLEGLLGADMIGFHTYDYSQHFLQCVLRILGHEHNLGYITLPSGIVRVETFPMGIDYEKFSRAAAAREVQQEKAELRKSLPEGKVILSVDRLDYSKGIINRLLGFETLLDANPQFRGKVVLIMIVVPSRVMVEEYERMKKHIEEQVGKINGRFGGIGWTPVIYQYRYLPFPPLVAMYSMSDVSLVTPLRDGMNLVAKEYVATRADMTGVLILSEMAGSAKELGEAIVINPSNREEIADALKEALEMPVEEQKRRNQIMQARLRRYDVLRWANDFVEQLLEMRQVQSKFLAKLMSASVKARVREDYRRAGRRLFFLDYDGTLVPFARRPSLAQPTEELRGILTKLAEDAGNTVVIISGRDRDALERWFGAYPISLVAEHGVWIREPGETWKHLKELTSDWKSHILPILELYADRLPGSFVEEKEFAIAWHYRESDPEQQRLLVGEVKDHLVTFTANIDVQVLQGNKVIEVKNSGVTKGTAAQRWLTRRDAEFVLAIGDDWTDEDLFGVLPESAVSIRVGVTSTRARYNVRDTRDVLRFLELLVRKADT